MCLSETSFVALVCAGLTALVSIVTTSIKLKDRSLDRYRKKQEAIFRALRLLDTYYSFLDFSSGITPKRDGSYNATKMTIEVRECFEDLCITVEDVDMINAFLDIFLDSNINVLESLNKFRNLCRKELGLKEIPYDNERVFLSVVSTNALEELS